MSDKSASQVRIVYKDLLNCESRDFFVNRYKSGGQIYYSLMVNYGEYSVADTVRSEPWSVATDMSALEEMLMKLKKDYVAALSESLYS